MRSGYDGAAAVVGTSRIDYDSAPMDIVEARAVRGRRALREVAKRALPPSVAVWHGPRDTGRIALTFDDGPATMTRAYLDALDAAGASATFFVIGQMCARRRDDLLEIVRRGHEVGSHGYVHERFSTMSTDALRGELDRTAALLPPTPRGRPLVRPPHGAISIGSLAITALAGYRTVLWSLDSDDCRTDDADAVVKRVVDRAQNGDIVLLHEEQRWTLDAISPLVAGLRQAGFELVTVGALLGR